MTRKTVKYFSDFSRGLNTDNAQPGDGWAEIFHDVFPMRQGQVTQRGGRSLMCSIEGSSSYDSFSAHGAHVYSAAVGGVYSALPDPVPSDEDTLFFFSPDYSLGILGPAFRMDGDGVAYDGGDLNEMFESGTSYNDELILSHIDNGDTEVNVAPIAWAGVDPNSAYRTGTVATTDGSDIVVGTATLWATDSNVVPDMYLYIQNAASLRTFRILRVVDDTHLVVDRAPDFTVAAQKYAAQGLGRVSAPADLFANNLGISVPWPEAASIVAHQDRLFSLGCREYNGGNAKYFPHRVRWSASEAEFSGQFKGRDYWQDSAFVDVAVGLGSGIVCGASWGDSLVVVKDQGIVQIVGEFESDGSPSGTSMHTISGFAGTSSPQSVGVSEIGVIIAGQETAWAWSGGQLRDLCKGRVSQFYRDFFRGTPPQVSCLNGRIVFHANAGDESDEPISDLFGYATLVYDYVFDIFYSTSKSASMGRIVQAGYGQPAPCGALSAEVFLDGQLGILNWADDQVPADGLSTNGIGHADRTDGDGHAPGIHVLTPPINPAPERHLRATHFYLHGVIADEQFDGEGDNAFANITIAADAGQWKFVWNGVTSGNIAFNAAGTVFLAALEAMSNIAPGDVTVEESGTGPSEYILTWTGSYASMSVPAPTIINGTTPLSGSLAIGQVDFHDGVPGNIGGAPSLLLNPVGGLFGTWINRIYPSNDQFELEIVGDVGSGEEKWHRLPTLSELPVPAFRLFLQKFGGTATTIIIYRLGVEFEVLDE